MTPTDFKIPIAERSRAALDAEIVQRIERLEGIFRSIGEQLGGYPPPARAKCTFCQAAIPNADRSQVLEHVKNCAQHPMREIEAKLANLERENTRLGTALYLAECEVVRHEQIPVDAKPLEVIQIDPPSWLPQPFATISGAERLSRQLASVRALEEIGAAGEKARAELEANAKALGITITTARVCPICTRENPDHLAENCPEFPF